MSLHAHVTLAVESNSKEATSEYTEAVCRYVMRIMTKLITHIDLSASYSIE